MFTSRGKYLFLCAGYLFCIMGSWPLYSDTTQSFSLYIFFCATTNALFGLSTYACVLLILFAMHKSVFCCREGLNCVHKSLLRLIFPTVSVQHCVDHVIWLFADSILMATRPWSQNNCMSTADMQIYHKVTLFIIFYLNYDIS